MTTYKLWEKVPFLKEFEPVLEYYPAEDKKTNATVIVFPGGGYVCRAEHEGEAYARFLNSIGMDAFVLEYRVAPDSFPAILLDARRAFRFVRANNDRFNIDVDRIAVMGSSAGGHLAALVSTFSEQIDGEGIDDVDSFPYSPNATIMCYPVIHYPDELNISHEGSFINFCGDKADFSRFSPDLLVSDDTPQAFIWHTSEDQGVSVINSYMYASALRRHGIPHELHVFPFGGHGYGLAQGDKHVHQWTSLLKNWFVAIGWLD